MAGRQLQKFTFTIGDPASSTTMLVEEITTDVASPNRTLVLILAEEWFGKLIARS